MSDKSSIEWTDATWNPIRVAPHQWYCETISPGCDNCYASMFNHRWGAPKYPRVGTPPADRPAVYLDEQVRTQPYRWKRPRMIFVCSMTDLFGEWVPDAWVMAVLDVMVIAKQHTFQVLTKRPGRMYKLLGGVPLPSNIWVGTTIESDAFTWRANVLRKMAAQTKFISAEPLLSGLPSLDLTGIDWLITGGESGPKHRLLDLDWVRDLRDRCQASGTAYFHKQHGGRTPKSGGRELDGREWNEFPQSAVAVPA